MGKFQLQPHQLLPHYCSAPRATLNQEHHHETPLSTFSEEHTHTASEFTPRVNITRQSPLLFTHPSAQLALPHPVNRKILKNRWQVFLAPRVANRNIPRFEENAPHAVIFVLFVLVLFMVSRWLWAWQWWEPGRVSKSDEQLALDTSLQKLLPPREGSSGCDLTAR